MDRKGLYMNIDCSKTYKQNPENRKGRKAKAMQEAHSNPFFSTFSFSLVKHMAKNELYFWGHDYN